MSTLSLPVLVALRGSSTLHPDPRVRQPLDPLVAHPPGLARDVVGAWSSVLDVAVTAGLAPAAD